MKIFIGVAVGFILWTILWLGSEPVIFLIAPEWNHEGDLSRVVTEYLIVKLALSSLFSFLAGYISAVISRDVMRGPTILGILLLIVGLAVQISIWESVPTWFHSLFLGLLLPLTLIGGRVHRT